ncbi:putative helicase MAGATAMA 3 [Bienertia sinuspersici]
MRTKQLEKKCKKVKKEEHRGIDLLDLVFSWSLEDVLNKDLFKDKVKQIPESFPSVVDYLNSFIDPLIEETHADFCSSLENAAQAPICEITVLRIRQNKPPMYDISTDIIMDTNLKNNGYLPKTGDVFLLTGSRLDHAEDLNTSGEAFLMAFVIRNGIDRSCDYHILTSKKLDSHFSPHKPKRLFATYMINLTTNMRIWWGLNRNPHSSKFSLIKSVLHYEYDSSEQTDCSVAFSENISVSDLISSFSLDESQKSSILSSISMRNCSHSIGCSKVKLIWGPPGTGKTKTVASLLFALLKLKCRTLTCAPTNIAVVQVVKRLMSLVLTSHDKYGNCRVGDIVLFGNAERMNTDEDDALTKVFLSNRVYILNMSIREWKSTMESIMSLLSNPEKQYNEYIEAKKGNQSSSMKMTRCHKHLMHLTNLSLKESRNNCVEEGNKSSVYLLTLEDFMERKFYSLAETLRLCANNFFTHLPTSCIPSELETDAIPLIDQLKNLGSTRKNANHFSELIIKRMELLAFCKRLDVLFKRKEDTWDMCLSKAGLIFCTASNSIKMNANVEMVIIDEAAQLKESDSVIPLSTPGVKCAVLIGDDQQLPAMVQSKVSANANFGRSLFQRLGTLGKKKQLLNIQYRMHPSISLFPNKEFYQNKIINAPHVKEINYQRNFLEGAMYGSYTFINVERGKESFTKGHSPRNVGEADVIEHIIAKLFNEHHIKKQKVSVGIISPYKGQVSLIQEKIGKKYANYNEKFAVNVRTVDGFQGGEEDIIIISTVRCNGNGFIGFLSNHQRTNVALTRARYCLWIVGSAATLAKSGSIWEDLVIDAKTRGCYYNADDNIDLKAMTQISAAKLKCSVSLELGNTIWKVIFADDFKISIASMENNKSQQQVQEMLKKIAGGWRQPNSEKAIDGVAAELLKLYKIDEQFYLTWTVDVQNEESKYTQVIKVWDILPASKIPNLAEELNILFQNYTVKYINRCKHKSFQGNVAVPMSWPLDSEPSAKNLTDRFSAMNISDEDQQESISILIRNFIRKLWRWIMKSVLD